MKVLKKTVKFPVFSNYRINIIAATDIKKYMSENSEFCDVCMSDDDSNTEAITLHSHETGASAIVVPLSASVNTIAHECYHAVRKMLEMHDVELGNEVVAYHLGYLVGEVFSLVRGRK